MDITGPGVQGAGYGAQKSSKKTHGPLHPEKGFTLIELMIVVIIIAGLAAMVVPRLLGRTDQANRTIAKADISSNIAMALKLYYLDNGKYPTTEQGLAALVSVPSPAPANWSGPYLETVPEDPWGNVYKYQCPGAFNKTTYDLYSSGSDGLEATDDDIKNWK